MLMEDLTRYIEEYVAPTISEFKRNPASVRHAFLACVATFHSIDYFAYPRRSRTLRDQFKRKSRDFAVVDDVAHAFKHVEVSDRNGPKLNSNDVVPRFTGGALGGMALGEAALGEGRQFVTLRGNSNVDVLVVVERAVEFIQAEAQAITRNALTVPQSRPQARG